ncbi:hypothetical protein [Nocardioides sp. zg-DK7169]|uniref:hypothetical protein n=1 Tax=Nocardioides sp. zg-DK7169 TaxID=2736600 RepID=UPI001555B41C|nr:hypothetical protein [Nocardioides sp. zg-DK7169]NPC96605.1 hypothetical protein [Nocardioides sp. zg-DK7169]
MTSSTEQVAPQRLLDSLTDLVAPRAIEEPLTRLAGTEEVLAAHVHVDLDHNARMATWRAVWVTPTRVLYAQATKTGEYAGQWSATTRDQRPDTAAAWARRVSAVTLVEIRDSHPRERGNGSDELDWFSRDVITFADGTQLRLPLTGYPPETRKQRDAAQAVTSVILAAMPC